MAVMTSGTNDNLHRTMVALRGVVAIALGACAIAYRGYSTVLVGAFVVFLFVDGIARLVSALRSFDRDKAWLIHALEGIAAIALGVVTVKVARSLISLTWTIVEWAFIVGALSIVFALVTFGRLRDSWLWLLGGLLLVALGGALLWFTGAGLLAPGIALGVFGILYGIVTLLIAARAS